MNGFFTSIQTSNLSVIVSDPLTNSCWFPAKMKYTIARHCKRSCVWEKNISLISRKVQEEGRYSFPLGIKVANLLEKVKLHKINLVPRFAFKSLHPLRCTYVK